MGVGVAGRAEGVGGWVMRWGGGGSVRFHAGGRRSGCGSEFFAASLVPYIDTLVQHRNLRHCVVGLLEECPHSGKVAMYRVQVFPVSVRLFHVLSLPAVFCSGT